MRSGGLRSKSASGSRRGGVGTGACTISKPGRLVRSGRQFPRQNTVGIARLAVVGLPRSGPCLDRRRVLGERKEAITIQEPQKPGLIDPGKRLIAVAAKQIKRSPAERRGVGRPTVEKDSHVIDETLPSAWRDVAGRVIGVEPRETLGPCTGDAASVLDNRCTFVINRAPYWSMLGQYVEAGSRACRRDGGRLSRGCLGCLAPWYMRRRDTCKRLIFRGYGTGETDGCLSAPLALPHPAGH